jgi:uncharacterized protein YbaP (TraB family)
MKLRNAGVVAVVLAAMVSCDKGQERGKPAVAPVTQGGTSDPWSAREPAKDPLKKPLFWRLEKDGKTSYVLGTMHLGVDPTTRLPDVVWQQLDAKPTFAMEADLSDPSKLGIQRTDGKTLRDELGDEYWAKLEAALGSQARAMMKMKAMIPATVLAMRGLPQTAPMDSTLLARAKSQHKNIVYLETLESEGVVLEKWMNARALKDMLDDLEGTEQRAKKMLDAYVAGEGEQMMAVFEEERAIWKKKGHPESEFDEQMNDLLYKRNASWIAPIEQLHAAGGGFIAIGAAHALGPASVLDLLAKKGFAITRVTP